MGDGRSGRTGTDHDEIEFPGHDLSSPLELDLPPGLHGSRKG